MNKWYCKMIQKIGEYVMDCPYYDTKECGKECIAQDHMEYLCVWAMMMVINQYGLRIE